MQERQKLGASIVLLPTLFRKTRFATNRTSG
jgi:hypothetical protein